MTFGERAINLLTNGALDRFEMKAQQAVAAMGQMVHSRPQLTLLMPRTRYDFQSQVGNGLGSAVIMAPVLWIARTFPEAPIIVKESDEIVEGHPMAQLIHHPNPHYSGSVLWMATLISWTLDGNAYWIKIRNAGGVVIQLWYVPHWMMRPYQESPADYITKYLYTPSGRRIELDPSEVVHLRFGLDPENTMKGFGQLKPLFREIFTDDEAANWGAHLLRNSGVPGLIVAPAESSGQSIPEADLPIIKEDLRNAFTGDRRGDPAVFSSAIDVHKFAWSPSEMDMGKLREIPEERVCATLGVPAAVVGFGSGLAQTKVGATMEQMLKQAYQSCLIPSQRMIAEELDSQLLPEFEKNPEKRRTAFDYRQVRALQEDEDALAKRQVLLFQGGLILKSEGRQAIGKESDPSDDVYILPYTMTEVPKGSTSQEVAANAKPGADAAAASKGWHPTELKISRRQAQLVRQLDVDAKHLATGFATRLQAHFNRIGEQAASAFTAKEKMRIPELLGARNGNGRKAPGDLRIPEPSPHGGSDRILVEQILYGITAKPMDYKPEYLRILEATVNTINAKLGAGINLTDDLEHSIVAAGGKRMGLVDVEAQARDSLFKALAEGRELGEGADAMAKRIRSEVAAGPWSSSEIRARVIARTETKYAQNYSSIEASESGAGIDGMTMIDAQLGPTDEECEAMNGQEVSFDEARQLIEDEHPNGTRSCIPRMGE